MNRSEAVREIIDGQYQAIKVTQLLSNLIAEEIETHIDYVKADGDIYGLAPGLIKAAAIARNYNPEEKETNA